MSGKHPLNGCDYLMLGFDHELRRRGFAGNSCQIVLELASAISPDTLIKHLAARINRHPILRAYPGGIILPKWKPSGHAGTGPQVRVHRDEPGLRRRLLNEPLAIHRAELLRFDLVERAGGRMDLLFTWTHALMDAVGAEHLLATVGREELSLNATQTTRQRRPTRPMNDRVKLAWKYLHHLDTFCKAPPLSLGVRHRNAPPQLEYRVEKFSAEETEHVRANGVRLCGILGEAQFHAAVSVLELYRLRERLGCPSPSYVLPIPVGLRLKGSIEPLFSNQLTMLMFQFLPEHLDSTASAVAALKTQTEEAMHTGLIESGLLLSDMFRFLPLPLYMAILKQGLSGEICSLFYGDTAAVTPLLTNFLGATVEDFAHVAAVTPSPGLGVIFYSFRGALRVTVVHSAQVLSDAEAAEFAANLRARLLNP